MNCLQCGEHTDNPKFCGRSCAASYNNQKYFKRTRKKFYCQKCGKEAKSRRQFCETCNPMKGQDYSQRTLADLRSLADFHGRIRQIGRKFFFRTSTSKRCAVCGYDKFVEICHIKPIQDLPEDTPISVVND
jgi:hypothetical protein